MLPSISPSKPDGISATPRTGGLKRTYIPDAADLEAVKKIRANEIELKDRNTVLRGVKTNVSDPTLNQPHLPTNLPFAEFLSDQRFRRAIKVCRKGRQRFTVLSGSGGADRDETGQQKVPELPDYHGLLLPNRPAHPSQHQKIPGGICL